MQTLVDRVDPGELSGTGRVLSYLVVSDLEVAVRKAEERGAVRMAGPVEAEAGTFVLLADAGGRMIGIFSPN